MHLVRDYDELPLSRRPFFSSRVDESIFTDATQDSVVVLDNLDDSGYDLCALEVLYAQSNGFPVSTHRNGMHRSIRYPWLRDLSAEDEPRAGRRVHLNHSYFFERKGFVGEAFMQLQRWCYTECPKAVRLLHLLPKWGLDVSIDYCDDDGNAFEVFHYEWDAFHLDQVVRKVEEVERIVFGVDWYKAAADILSRRDEWESLSFFEQSWWKCRYFGLSPEQFKVALWAENE